MTYGWDFSGEAAMGSAQANITKNNKVALP